MPKMHADTVIIGAGIAGLSAALQMAKLQPKSRIVILSKSLVSESNSAYAQGGIAAVMNTLSDSYEAHKQDTIRAGGGIGNEEMIETLVHEAPKRILELVHWGARFDYENDGKLSLGLEGGHSAPRIVHTKDQTGRIVIDTLLNKVREHNSIHIFENSSVLHLLKTESGDCGGICAWNQKQRRYFEIKSKNTLLATGGSGQLFRATTNPLSATGDGIALAYKTGASVSNMQYVQFHPTAFYQQDTNPMFLISEAVRGAGAFIRNHRGERFVFDYDPRGELATRDIVSSAIFNEMNKQGTSMMFLDATHLPKNTFEKQFPLIHQHLSRAGYPPEMMYIPIRPAAHYQCGGIDTDKYGRTNIPGLYALGECANTGIQGNNRLASNSLSEGLVFAQFAAESMAERVNTIPFPTGYIPFKRPKIVAGNRFEQRKYRMRIVAAMDVFTMEADENTFKESRTQLQELINAIEDTVTTSASLLEIQNMAITAQVMLEQKIQHLHTTSKQD
jgi:L-aspartate oxidase